MSENWPPDGYSTPREYQKNERHIFAVAFVLVGLFGVAVLYPVVNGVAVYNALWTSIADGIGISNQSIVMTGSAITALVGLTLLFRKVIVPVHEALHYGVGLFLNLNPDFGYEEGRFFKNPRVVAISTDIPVWKNLLMLITPFVVIGLLSWGMILISSGLLAGIAAVVLWVNSAASAQDIYHYFRLLRMDPQARFANFERGDEIRTEYVLPEQ